MHLFAKIIYTFTFLTITTLMTAQIPDTPFLTYHLPISWKKLSPEAALKDIPQLILNTKNQLNKITHIQPENATYENTFEAFDTIMDDFNYSWSLFDHLKSVADSPQMRDAYNVLLPQVIDFTTTLYLNQALYKTFCTTAQKLTQTTNLTAIQQRLITETLEDFREQGAELNATDAESLKSLQQELAKLTQQFVEQVLDTTQSWELIITDKSKLSGLPASAIEAAFENAKLKEIATIEKPAWRFTLNAPSMGPILDYADDETLRKTIWEGVQTIGHTPEKDNRKLISPIIELRTKIAHLLGKNHFPDFILHRRMAKTGAQALQFIKDLKEKVLPAAHKEWNKLLEFRAKSLGLTEITLMEPWDVAYWMEKWRKAEYDFDNESLRPYFSENKVIQGLFNLSSQLFNIIITEIPLSENQLWDKAVRYYQIQDGITKNTLGYFYTDWYPRENKKDGAWMSCISVGHPLNLNIQEPHIGTINGNFTLPLNNQPALLTHREVQTLFHEFGHLLHHLLSEVPMRSLSGVNVAWDFVEFPSQLMENWCWERESLDLFATHFQSEAGLPEDLFEKMTKARHFMAANQRLRQLMLANLDLELHLNPACYTALSPDTLENTLRQNLKDYFMPLKTIPPLIISRFSHIFGSATGYAAGYYSYQWAEILEADAFSRFLEAKEGLLSPTIGKALRDAVLSKGNSQNADELFFNFMHRSPNPDAALKRDGLL